MGPPPRIYSEGHDVFFRFAEYFSTHDIQPHHVPGAFIRERPDHELRRFGRAFNVGGGHTFGKLYEVNFERSGFQGRDDRIKKLTAGAIVEGPSVGMAHDKVNVGIDELSKCTSPLSRPARY